MSEAVAGQGLVLSESRPVRLFSFFLLYFGQGLPLGVAQIALPAWLVMNGAEEAAVGALIGTAFLAWSFKFIPAAVMDRYAYLPMGRRRAWLIGAQVLTLAGFALAGWFAPGPDDLDLLLYIIFMVAAGSAVQDVAVDGLAVDILREEEQGTASAFMFGGQATGMAASGAGAGYLLQYHGSQAMFLGFLPIVLLITLYVIFLRERPGEKRFPWSDGNASPVNLDRQVAAWWPIFRTTIASLVRVDSLKLIAASAVTRTAGGIMTTLWPIIGGVGFLGLSTASYSGMISTVGLVMAVVSIGIGSAVTLWLGARRSSVLIHVTYALLALFVLYFQSVWLGFAAFVAMSCVWYMHDVLTSVFTNPLRMQLSDPQVAATQFTIYNSLSNLPVSFGAITLFAWLGGTENMEALLWTVAGLMLLGAAVFAWMEAGSRSRREEAAALPVMPADPLFTPRVD